MKTPKPGHKVRGSSTGRPLMAALDLFGRRWNLRIVWELRAGALGFRALQQRCDNMSSRVLRQRLAELLDARLVEQLPDTSYALSALGQDAYQALRPLSAGPTTGLPNSPTSLRPPTRPEKQEDTELTTLGLVEVTFGVVSGLRRGRLTGW